MGAEEKLSARLMDKPVIYWDLYTSLLIRAL